MIWEVETADSILQKKFADGLKISHVAAGLLANRGIESLEEAKIFMEPELKDLHDPFLLKGMSESTVRIKEALGNGDKILICGDYDVDGLTAAALLVIVLKELGGNASSHIPHRVRDGYGLNEETVRAAGRDGVKLIITVDCGSNSISEVIEAKKLKMDVIITDHHEFENLAFPPAIAVINPHRPDCSYPCKDLSGVGVALKVVQALLGIEGVREHLDLAALGTVADVVPVKGENRILVKHGLEELRRTKKPGLRALMQVSGIPNGRLTEEQVAFILAPRINAPGRLDSADISLKLLLSKSEKEAFTIASELEKSNRRRKVVQNKILKNAREKVEEELKKSRFPVIVLADEAWHPGLVGIAAGRLVEEFCRPAILIAMDGDKGKGSARSIEQFHILNALRECRELLQNFGGHSQAAGLVISRKNLAGFRRRMEQVGEEKLDGKDLVPKLKVDMELDLSEITEDAIEEMSCMEPYGPGNREPVFVSREVQVMYPRVLKDKHLKMRVAGNGNARGVSAIGFGMADCIDMLAGGENMDIVYSPRMNEWKGAKEMQLQLIDIKGR